MLTSPQEAGALPGPAGSAAPAGLSARPVGARAELAANTEARVPAVWQERPPVRLAAAALVAGPAAVAVEALLALLAGSAAVVVEALLAGLAALVAEALVARGCLVTR